MAKKNGSQPSHTGQCSNIDYFLYARKSTDVEDKQVRSIDAQLAELTEFARASGVNVKEIIVERESAKTPGARNQFNAMLDRIAKGEAAGILAWHPDRLARNMTDGGRVIDLIDTGRLRQLRFPTFWFEPTPQGKFMLGMAFSQSKYYIDSLSENTRRGLREKVRKGEFPGRAPLGYMNDRRSKTLTLDKETAPIVIEMFNLYAGGDTTIGALQAFLTAHGVRSSTGRPVPKSTITSILKNPLYYGQFRYGGDVHEGNHPPVISKRLFDAVQDVLASRWRYTPDTAKSVEKPFRGLLRCATCGLAITAEIQKGHIYYRCTKKRGAHLCRQPYIRQEELQRQLCNMVRPFSITERCASYLLARMRKEEAEHVKSGGALVRELKKEVTALEARAGRLTDMRLAGEIDADEFFQRKRELMSHKKTNQEKIVEVAAGRLYWLEPFENWVLAARNLDKTIATGSPSAIRELVEKVFGSNLRLNDKVALGEATNPWSEIPTNVREDTFEHLYYHARTACTKPKSRDFAPPSQIFKDNDAGSY